MNININKEINGLPFGQPSKHTLQNMLTHQLLWVIESLDMVRLRSSSILYICIVSYYNQAIA